jgi:hypothetical protein
MLCHHGASPWDKRLRVISARRDISRHKCGGCFALMRVGILVSAISSPDDIHYEWLYQGARVACV